MEQSIASELSNPPTMSTILRTLRNIRKIGIKEYAHQMQYIGDTKAGTYIASDKYGNKYYENLEQELPRASPAGSPATAAKHLPQAPDSPSKTLTCFACD